MVNVIQDAWALRGAGHLKLHAQEKQPSEGNDA